MERAGRQKVLPLAARMLYGARGMVRGRRAAPPHP
jgi:hypothetical protein